MKPDISVVVLSASRQESNAFVDTLLEQTWEPIIYREASEVCRHIQQTHARHDDIPVLLVLTDNDERSYTAASCLRSLFPLLGIALVYGKGNEPGLADCFQHGVDIWVPAVA